MHLTGFEHLRPASMVEAAQMLHDFGPRARLVAGGTDLFPRIKLGLTRPEVIVSLKGLTLNDPQIGWNGNLHMNALVRLADIACSPAVSEKAPMLAEAALGIGSSQIRHMGTLGGNICLENRCSYYNQSHTFQFVEPCFKRRGDRCYLIPKGKKCLAIKWYKKIGVQRFSLPCLLQRVVDLLFLINFSNLRSRPLSQCLPFRSNCSLSNAKHNPII